MRIKITVVFLLMNLSNIIAQNLNFINKANKLIARSASSSCIDSNGNIYISNGFPANGYSTPEIEKYNPIADSWTYLNTSSSATATNYGNSEITMGTLCLFNGVMNKGEINNKFQKIDLSNGNLNTSLTLNPNPVYGAGSEFYNQYLLSFGGCSDTFNANFSKKFYQISINPETFTQLSDMPIALQTKGKIMLDGTNQALYVFGGYKETNNSTENFESTIPNTNLVLTDWINVVETGTKLFKAKQFNLNKYAEITAFDNVNQEPSNTNWLISNQLNSISTQQIFLNFDTRDGYNNGATLQVFLITNWTGDILTATKTILNCNISSGNLFGYANDFTNSGNILLPSNLTNFRIGFKYTGGYSPIRTTTYLIDNIRVFKTNISDNIYKYNFYSDSWTTLSTLLPQSLSAYGLSKINNSKTIITGDYNNQTFTGIFDSQNETFTTLSQTNMIGRRHHNSEFWNNKLYIIGGNTTPFSSSVLASTQSTDLSTLSFDEFISNSDFKIYPNPANTFINLNEEYTKVFTYAFDGKKIELPQENKTINISELSNGIYLLIGESNDGKKLKTKFVKK